MFDKNVHGLRGACCLSVLAFHAIGSYKEVSGDASTWHFFLAHGVDVFFVISGFLIYPSVARHRSRSAFLRDRAWRIYPAFLVIHALVFGLGPLVNYKGLADPGTWSLHVLADAVFLPGIFPIQPIQVVAWSLSYEWLFYLLAAGLRGKGPWPLVAACAALSIWFPGFLMFAVGIVVHVVGGGGRWLPPFLSARLFMFLGTVSYSLYLWHTPVIFAMRPLLGRFALMGWVGMPAFVAAVLVVASAVSYLSHRWFERFDLPFRLRRTA